MHVLKDMTSIVWSWHGRRGRVVDDNEVVGTEVLLRRRRPQEQVEGRAIRAAVRMRPRTGADGSLRSSIGPRRSAQEQRKYSASFAPTSLLSCLT